jgi:hypothetical protein
MSKLSITELYDHLVAKLGKETAEKLTTFIGSEMSDKFEYNLKTLATKEDLAKFALVTKEDIAKLALTTKEDIAKLAFSTKEDLAKLSFSTKEDLAKLALTTKVDLAKLDNKINETKIDIIKWIFAFWVTVILLFIGLYFKS